MDMETALVIIDVQSGIIDLGAYQSDDVLARIDGLLTRARAAGIPVIYVQHREDDPNDLLYPDNPGWAIHPAIAPHEGEPIVHKTTPDSFHETNFKQILAERGIHKLIIVGMQTEYCVNATTRRAVDLGYDVTLVKDAHTTLDEENITAKQIIDEHNAAFNDICRLLEAEQVTFA
jgi:nicotinamidase-related amidase